MEVEKILATLEVCNSMAVRPVTTCILKLTAHLLDLVPRSLILAYSIHAGWVLHF